jgi:hypothetical protein
MFAKIQECQLVAQENRIDATKFVDVIGCIDGPTVCGRIYNVASVALSTNDNDWPIY